MLLREPKRVLKNWDHSRDLPGFRWPSADGVWESEFLFFSEQPEPQWGETAQVRPDSASSAPSSAS